MERPSPLARPLPAVPVAVLVAVLLVAAACGGPPPVEAPTPAGDEHGRFCPLPMTWAPGEPRPVRVRLENRTADTVTVFIDRCYWHTWMANVPPGKYRQPELPEKLVVYPEGLRFHAYDLSRRTRLGIYTVAHDGGPILTVVLDSAGRADPDSLARFALDESQQDDRIGSFSVMTTESGGYAAVWAREGLGVATWSCAEGRRGMAVSVPRELEGDEVAVSLRRDGGGFEEAGRWRVQRGIRDAVVPADAALDDVRRRFGGRGVVDLLVDDGGERQVHRFRVEGLEEALASLDCWGSPPPQPPTPQPPGTSRSRTDSISRAGG